MHTDIVIKDPTACTQMQVYPFKLYCNHWPCDAEFFLITHQDLVNEMNKSA